MTELNSRLAISEYNVEVSMTIKKLTFRRIEVCSIYRVEHSIVAVSR